MGKYHFGGAALRPFVGVGYAPRVVHGTHVASGSFLSAQDGSRTFFFNQHSDTNYSMTHGVVASGGLEFRAGHLHISPEVRYVHWGSASLNSVGGDGSFEFTSKQDEFFVMLGVTWGNASH